MLIICRGDVAAEGLSKALKTPEGRALVMTFPSRFREGLDAFLNKKEDGGEAGGVPLSLGLMQALWTLAEREKCGMRLFREALRPNQYVIECCERLGLDPYRLPGRGSVFLAENVREGEQVLGITTKEKSRIIQERDGVRFLVPPERGY